MKTRTVYLTVLLSVLLAPKILAQSNVAESNIFSLDTRSGSTITGQVVDRARPQGPYLPLSGATVAVNGLSVTTGSDGRFELKAALEFPTDLSVSATGFVGLALGVGPAETGEAIDVGIVRLPPVSDGPVVESVTLEPEWNFLHGHDLQTEVVAKINWLDFEPVRVELRSGGALLDSIETSNKEVRFPLDIDSTFPRGYLRGLDLRVKAFGESAEAPGSLKDSEEVVETIYVFPWPDFLDPMIGDSVKYQDRIALDFNLRTTETSVTLPVLGRFGYQFGLGLSFDYGLLDGSFEAALGLSNRGRVGKRGRRPKIPGFTNYDRPRLYIGNREVEMEIFARREGVALPNTGIDWSDEVAGGVSLQARLELTRYGLLDLIGPGLTTAVRKVAGEAFVRNFSVRLDALPEIDGQAVFAPRLPLDFKEATVRLGLGLEAIYAPKVAGKSASVYVGGQADGTFGMPEPIFREVNFKAYAGLEVEAWVFNVRGEYVFLNYTYPSRRLPLNAIPIDGGYLLPGTDNERGWSLMERPWREAGEETFLLKPAAPGRRLSYKAAEALDTQSAFARMGQAASPGAIYQPAAGPARRLISDPDLPAQAELPLLANVFPDSEPALTAQDDQLMLLYVRDTGEASPVQFTEVAFTRFDGTSWSAPEAIANDPRAQFSPQVAFDGNGDAIAIFERVKDANYSGSDLNAFTGLMEIVWSQWDADTQTWSAPQSLTDNAFLDFQPQLAGPLADGDLIATWFESPTNELDGASDNERRVLTARWDAATGSWTAPEALVETAVGFLGSDLAAGGDEALFVWSADLDGDLTDTTDSELRYRRFESGAWGGEVRHTTDAIADRNPQAWVDASGNEFVVWSRDQQLVLAQGFGAPTIAREAADNLGVADFALTGGPAGNLVLIWQEMSENGSDAHFRVYDPSSGTWGLDTLLSADSDLERSFAPVWDAAGNLTVAYNNVTINNEMVSVEVGGGDIIDVEGVPQPGQVDMLVAKRALVRDLEVVADSLSVEGLSYLPGDEVALSATVRNSGNVALENVAVRFYDGDPAEGAEAIHSETIPGWFAANDTREISFVWVLPASSEAPEVFATVDPDGAITEFSETNNTAALTVGGVDLEVVYRSGEVLRDGSARIVADVANRGSPASPVTEIALLNSEIPEAPLQTQTLGQIAPGGAQTVIFELPAGSHPQGETIYRLVVDPDDLSGDVDPTNNETSFALLLWIDDDGDGLPQWWEAAHGLSDADPTDGQQDRDGDGFTDAEEYFAGTDPLDGGDNLTIGEFNVVETPGVGGVLRNTLSWASVEGAVYDVQRAFAIEGPWETIRGNVAATPPLNTVTDETATSVSAAFYRVISK